jgi:hypothetical protein
MLITQKLYQENYKFRQILILFAIVYTLLKIFRVSVKCSVVDPDRFDMDTDLDPAFQFDMDPDPTV